MVTNTHGTGQSGFVPVYKLNGVEPGAAWYHESGFGGQEFQFASSSQATTFYRQLYAFTVRCRTVTASFHGTVRLTTQSLKKTHLGRLPAFLAKQTLSATGFPATINDTLTTMSGRDVVFIDAAGQKVPTKPALSTAVQHLVTRILHFGPRVPA